MVPFACRAVLGRASYLIQALPSQISKFGAPICLGETCRYFNQCDLFGNFHAIVEVQFGGLKQLDITLNNYKDNMNTLYCHANMSLSLERALKNIIVCAYAHYH